MNPLNFDLETVKICKDLWKDTVDTLAFYRCVCVCVCVCMCVCVCVCLCVCVRIHA